MKREQNKSGVTDIRVGFNKPCVSSYMGWGFPLASHSMTMVSLALTMCSFIDCFMMVGGCLTAGREINKLRLWQDDTNDKFKTLCVTDSPSRGTSKAQTLCHNRSSSAGSTIVPIFKEHGIQQYFSHRFCCPQVGLRAPGDMCTYRVMIQKQVCKECCFLFGAVVSGEANSTQGSGPL